MGGMLFICIFMMMVLVAPFTVIISTRRHTEPEVDPSVVPPEVFKRWTFNKQREYLIKTFMKGPVPKGYSIAFKGFRKDMTCRKFQYAEGRHYKTNDPVEVCCWGFHACTDHRDVRRYYDEPTDVYHIVFLKGIALNHYADDSKICASEIIIGPRIPRTYMQ